MSDNSTKFKCLQISNGLSFVVFITLLCISTFVYNEFIGLQLGEQQLIKTTFFIDLILPNKYGYFESLILHSCS